MQMIKWAFLKWVLFWILAVVVLALILRVKRWSKKKSLKMLNIYWHNN